MPVSAALVGLDAPVLVVGTFPGRPYRSPTLATPGVGPRPAVVLRPGPADPGEGVGDGRSVVVATREVLHDAGYRVVVPTPRSGSADTAGMPVIDLVPDPDPAAAPQEIRTEGFTLAGLLSGPGPDGVDYEPPYLEGVRVFAAAHVHRHGVVVDRAADLELLRRGGAHVEEFVVCCGPARDLAEQELLEALRADPDAVLLTHGLPRHDRLARRCGRRPLHLAEVLAEGADEPDGGHRPAALVPTVPLLDRRETTR